MFEQSTFTKYVADIEPEAAEKLRKLLRQDTNAPLHYWLDILMSHGFCVRSNADAQLPAGEPK
jgi:hypothetical protein